MFLDQIKSLGRQAGITDLNKLVNYIVWYSSEEIQRCIQYLPEFDPDEPGKTWDEAAKLLTYLHRSTEEPPTIRCRELEAFCRASSKAPRFTKRSQLDKYGLDFVKISGPLFKQQLLSRKEIDHLFVLGLPAKDLKYLLQVLPEENRVRSNPPSYFEVIDLLTGQLDDRSSLTTCDWDSNDSNDEYTPSRLDITLLKGSRTSSGSVPVKVIESP